MQAPRTPYNTGKVKIGLAYEPPRQAELTRDELHIQSALLGLHDNTQMQRDKLAWGVIFFLAILLLVVVYAPR